MSAPGPSRNLTLTEELEKLEQSITLTLQEIDHNFSKAHRIVTTSILPLVEQYGEHSKNVWEASKFWKQFFEASANVSLSGYEELANEGDTTVADQTTRLEDTTTTSDGGYVDQTNQSMADDQSTFHEQQQQQNTQHREIEDSLLDDGTLTGSTPRPPATKSMRPGQEMQFANFGSPYDDLRRELKAEEAEEGGGNDHTAGSVLFADDDDDDAMNDDTTQQLRQERLPDMSMTPNSSLLEAPTPMQGGGPRTNLFNTNKDKNKDPLLHRLLDKNYRIQATPHKGGGRSPNKGGAGVAGLPEEDRTRRALWQDSPQSSPEMAAPTLRTNLYSAMSPLKGQRGRPAAKAGGSGHVEAPRTPGVSVQTPAKKRDVFAEYRSGGGASGKEKDNKGKGKYDPDEITWDSDDEDDGFFGGMSPPKTIQFALPPSKLMQTPAREASKRIVEDILLTAGAAPEYGSTPEHSPTMVQMNHDILDDTF